MRKMKTIATCMLLGTAMALSSLTTAGATDAIPVGAEELPDGTLLINEDEVIIEGSFSTRHSSRVLTRKTRLVLEKTLRIALESDSETTCNVKVRFKDEKGVIKEFILKPGRSEDIYLLAGTYDMDLSYSSDADGRNPGSVKPYKITCDKIYETETFGETVDYPDEKMADAHKITLNKVVKGSIAANESKVDTFQFHSYYDDVPMFFYLCSYIPEDEGLSWAMYTPEALECLEQGDLSGAEAVAGGTLIFPNKDYTNTYIGENLDLPKGTYYLVLSSPADGGYYFSFNQVPDDGCERLSIYTTVGSSFVMKPDKDPSAEYSLTWESMDPSVVSLEDPASPDAALARKAGFVHLHGYGTKEPIEGGDPTHSYVYAQVKVEFTDVIHKDNPEDNPYYYEPVYWAVEEGITEGYKDKNGYYSKFKPQNDCTRAQIVTLLWRMQGSPEPKTLTAYEDVKETDYFYKAVSWAQETGITEGYPDGTFKPANVCSRSQIVTFLWRLDGRPEPDNISDFPDVKDTETYFYKAVNWAAENEITTGYPDGTFKPANKCTRCQAVTFLYRYWDMYVF